MVGNIERAAWIAGAALVVSAALVAWSINRSTLRIANRIHPADVDVSVDVPSTLTVKVANADEALAISTTEQPKPVQMVDLGALQRSFGRAVREKIGPELHDIRIGMSQYNDRMDRCYFAGLLEMKDGTQQPFACTLSNDGSGAYAGDMRHDNAILHAGIRISAEQ